MTKQPFEKECEAIVAINTFAMLYRFDLIHGVYGNSPNGQDFDGSATGYWERRAEYFGATKEELNQIKRDIATEAQSAKAKRGAQ